MLQHSATMDKCVNNFWTQQTLCVECFLNCKLLSLVVLRYSIDMGIHLLFSHMIRAVVHHLALSITFVHKKRGLCKNIHIHCKQYCSSLVSRLMPLQLLCDQKTEGGVRARGNLLRRTKAGDMSFLHRIHRYL